MKTKLACAGALLCLLLPSCGTVNSVRWAYGASSAFSKPDEFSEEKGLRAAVGVPLVLTSVAFDVATFPFQALFGVWPWWGDSSTMMKPGGE